jgi:hypothetical protein
MVSATALSIHLRSLYPSLYHFSDTREIYTLIESSHNESKLSRGSIPSKTSKLHEQKTPKKAQSQQPRH